MADTTTTLNPGTGGDVMDESQVSQSGGASPKRPRVVIGGDTGWNGTANDIVQPVSGAPSASPMALPTVPVGLVNDTPSNYLDTELRPLSLTPDGRLRVSATGADVYLDHFGETEEIENNPHGIDFFPSGNPFGT